MSPAARAAQGAGHPLERQDRVGASGSGTGWTGGAAGSAGGTPAGTAGSGCSVVMGPPCIYQVLPAGTAQKRPRQHPGRIFERPDASGQLRLAAVVALTLGAGVGLCAWYYFAPVPQTPRRWLSRRCLWTVPAAPFPATVGGATKERRRPSHDAGGLEGDVPTAPSSARARALALTRMRKRRRAARPAGSEKALHECRLRLAGGRPCEAVPVNGGCRVTMRDRSRECRWRRPT